MRLSITTPGGAIVDTDIDEVTAPGKEGEFGVLPEHIPLMAALKPGVLTYRAGGRTSVLAVGEGFLQVSPVPVAAEATTAGGGGGGGGGGSKPIDRVLVLVDRATGASAINRAAAQKELASAEAEIAAWKQELDGAYSGLLVRRDWALAQVNASERTSASTSTSTSSSASGTTAH